MCVFTFYKIWLLCCSTLPYPSTYDIILFFLYIQSIYKIIINNNQTTKKNIHKYGLSYSDQLKKVSSKPKCLQSKQNNKAKENGGKVTKVTPIKLKQSPSIKVKVDPFTKLGKKKSLKFKRLKKIKIQTMLIHRC